jgi:hypothetical protein
MRAHLQYSAPGIAVPAPEGTLIGMSARQRGLHLDDADSILAPASMIVITVIITQPAMSPRSSNGQRVWRGSARGSFLRPAGTGCDGPSHLHGRAVRCECV